MIRVLLNVILDQAILILILIKEIEKYEYSIK